MKKNERDKLIDRLQGFDGEELQHEMTDGLDQWCQQRRQQGRAVKRILVLSLLLLTTTAIAMTVLPMLHPSKKNVSDIPTSAETCPPAPHPPQEPEPILIDSVAVKKRTPAPVDYYYSGIAEDGYSVAYGHDTRTLTYTRYSGSHLIHSVVHNSPDIFFTDTSVTDTKNAVPQEDPPLVVPPIHGLVPCDFQTISPQGDALYFVIIDSVDHQVSVRGDVARWMGQPIRYNAILTLPATVEHDSILYTVTMLSDSAFMGHDEIESVCLPTTVTYIGDYAFADCSALRSFTVQTATPPEAFPASFDRVDAMLHLSVPCGSAGAYTNDAEWLYFRNIEENCASAKPVIRVIRKH